MIYTRQQFADMWNSEKPGLGNEGSPLWIPEHNWSDTDNDGPTRCEWFVCVKPLGIGNRVMIHTEFWSWSKNNLQGRCRCFSSAVREEWWGFTDKEDITLWMLKWT